MDCRRNQQRIEAYFARGLAPPQIAAMRAHTVGCPACQRHYDRSAALETTLCRSEAPALPARHVERLLLEIAARAAPEHPARERGWRWWALRLVPSAALLAAAVLPLVIWLRPAPQAEIQYGGHTFQVRGYADTPQGRHAAGVRAFCLRPTLAEQKVAAVEIEELVPGEGGAGTASACPLNGVLFFTATNLLEEPRQVFVLGLDQQLQARWYYPKPAEGRSRTLPPDTLDRALGRGIVLEVNHQPGAHRLFALVAEQEIDLDAVQAALDELRAGGRSLDRVEALPVAPDALQLRFDLEIEAGP